MKCSPCKENGFHFQRMSALKCVLSSGRFKVISMGFIQWSANFWNRLVHADNLRRRRVLEEAFDECKVCRFWGTRKSSFFPSFDFFRVDFVTFSCNVVGYAFDNVNFVVYIEENSCHLELPVLTRGQDWRWIFEESFNERIMWWSRSTNEGCDLFVVGWFRNYSKFFSDVVEDDAHDYLVLIVNVQKSKCHLGNEIFVSTNDVARIIEIWWKKSAQVVVVRRSEGHLYTSSVPFSVLL